VVNPPEAIIAHAYDEIYDETYDETAFFGPIFENGPKLVLLGWFWPARSVGLRLGTTPNSLRNDVLRTMFQYSRGFSGK
jgi:hypothetical protein